MAIYPQNLHTHGFLCDGKADYEDVVKRAIEIGFDSIGFSGHSHTGFDTSYCMSKDQTAEYKTIVNRLKKKYHGIIDVFCGIEFDIYSDDNLEGYDYVIGSVHYIKSGNEYIEIDPSSPDVIQKITDKYFGGDSLLLAKAYFETVAKLPEYVDCDIVGHFDLISKHCEKSNVIDIHSPIYKNHALEAISSVAEKFKIFEINVGSIARGYRFTPYPAPFLLKRIKELGCDIIISSDCHNPIYLDTNFDVGIELAKSCGFNEAVILTKNGFKEIKI